MSQKVHKPVHTLVNQGGATLWIPRSCFAPPRLLDPDIYAQSALQLYPLGSKLEFADGRVFRYGKFGATVTYTAGYAVTGRLLCNGNLVPGSAATYGYEGSLDATSGYAVGATTLVLNDEADRSLNHYEDGMLSTFPSGHFTCYRIAGSDAAASVDDVTIDLDDPNGLQTALVVNSTGVTAYPSMFSNMMNPGDCDNGYSYSPVVGMYLGNAVTASYYAWVQRKGPAWITPTAYFGDGASERLCQVHTFGESALRDSYTSQIVGYLTQMTVSGYGDGMIWLTLE
jgi:hypothetical protein